MSSEKLIERIKRIDEELSKYRDCSSLKDGWGTSVLAKKQRKADVLSAEKTRLRNLLFEQYNIEI